MAEKRRAFEEWLQRRDWVPYDITGPESGCEMGSSSCRKIGGLAIGRATGD